MPTFYKDMCQYCDSEDFRMIGDPEYNDLWICNECGKEFWTFRSVEINT